MDNILPTVWRSLPHSKNLQLFIMRLFQDQFLIGVTGIIFNEKDQILLFKHTYRTPSWSLPGGYLKAKEHPREGLVREIEEESGFLVSVDNRIRINTDRDTARLDICYIGSFEHGVFTRSDEVSDYGFFYSNQMPPISEDQIFLIESALRKRRPPISISPPPKPSLTYHGQKFIERIRTYLSPKIH